MCELYRVVLNQRHSALVGEFCLKKKNYSNNFNRVEIRRGDLLVYMNYSCALFCKKAFLHIRTGKIICIVNDITTRLHENE